MPALDEVLARTVSFLERAGIEYAVIGGFALPSYGSIRATVDLDIAVKVGTPAEFTDFVKAAGKAGFQPSAASFANPVNVFLDKKTGAEVELWSKPDGIEWDPLMLRRRKRARIGRTAVWLIPPEDFVVSKLARRDRGVQDEKDVKGVLTRMGERLDRGYLRTRARRAGVLPLLKAIEEG